MAALLSVLLLGCGTPEEAALQATATEGRPIAFTEVTAAAGLGDFKQQTGAAGNKWYPEPMGSGGGFLDYDGDGWLDILLAAGGDWEVDTEQQALWLYRNNGDGTFTETTEVAGLSSIEAYAIGVVAADYDNDGDQDVYVTNLGRNMLLRNEGGTFTEVGIASGVADEDIWSSSALFFDADKDGWLDLFVGNYVEWSPETDIWCPQGSPIKLYCVPATYEGVQSAFYRNLGDGTFVNATKMAGFEGALGKTLGVSEMDLNQDGWSDLAVANDGEGDLLYLNDGDGTFTEIGMRSGFAFSEHGEARAGMGIDSGVVDSSGYTTVFVGNFSEEMVGVYRYLGNGSFQDRAAISRIGYSSMQTLTFGLFLADFDLDTDLDLYIANGHVYPDRTGTGDRITYRQASQLFLNRGDGVFDEHPASTGLIGDKMVLRGAAYGDVDRDGDLDILTTENDGPAHLWRNDRTDGQFLRVRVAGTTSNRDGIGATIEARVGDLTMHRRIRTGSSYLSSHELAVTFGLGEHERVDELRVVFPSGQEARFSDIEANQEILVREGDSEFELVPLYRDTMLAASE
ncbi:MAG: CRTAC1 family protein [Rhodothermales bacterium]